MTYRLIITIDLPDSDKKSGEIPITPTRAPYGKLIPVRRQVKFEREDGSTDGMDSNGVFSRKTGVTLTFEFLRVIPDRERLGLVLSELVPAVRVHGSVERTELKLDSETTQ